MDDLHARVAVDRVAAKVTKPGEHFEPNKRVLTNDSDTPIAVQQVPSHIKDLTGTRFGRFTVIGFATKGGWVVRCACGKYSTRRQKAIINPENAQDRCEHCRHLAFLKWEDYRRRTGLNPSIREF
jgi:hypothetical protein